MQRVLCFGEILLRLSPQANGGWIASQQMPVFIGGAELNVATALAKWQQPVTYVSAMPMHALATDICSHLTQQGIDVSKMIFTGNRIGTYYLPQGADLKNSGVIYDRAHSSFANLTVNDISWDDILKDVHWVHITAISPALNALAADVCIALVKAAKAKGLTVSLDLNYRSKLWQYGQQPNAVMPAIATYCDVIMGNVWSAHTMLQAPQPHIKDATNTAELLQVAEATAAYIYQHFPTCSYVANTYRFDTPEGGIRYSAVLHTKAQAYTSPVWSAVSVRDKAGSGDCFMGGLIYGIAQQHTPQHIIDFAASAAFGKLQEQGDTTQQNIATIEARWQQARAAVV
ncbi:MAG TPA: carbohydrate kinase [Chitinophagaceae bacterium]|nr:carbohydrate kinase [Chitinophagaceae bacterium]HAN38808.1 carbohydrate kinase [Chitinophagaceae bacterium]